MEHVLCNKLGISLLTAWIYWGTKIEAGDTGCYLVVGPLLLSVFISSFDSTPLWMNISTLVAFLPLFCGNFHCGWWSTLQVPYRTHSLPMAGRKAAIWNISDLGPHQAQIARPASHGRCYTGTKKGQISTKELHSEKDGETRQGCMLQEQQREERRGGEKRQNGTPDSMRYAYMGRKIWSV